MCIDVRWTKGPDQGPGGASWSKQNMELYMVVWAGTWMRMLIRLNPKNACTKSG